MYMLLYCIEQYWVKSLAIAEELGTQRGCAGTALVLAKRIPVQAGWELAVPPCSGQENTVW